MRKTTILSSIILLFFSTLAFCTDFTAGVTYDTHGDSFLIGTDFSVKETFKDNSSLSTGLLYKNAGNYDASLEYSKLLSRFLLAGGLDYSISKTEIIPFITVRTGVVFPSFSLIASGGLNLNSDNIVNPDTYNCGASMVLDSGSSIIDLSFLYTITLTDDGNKSKIGGGLDFTAYKDDAPIEICFLSDVLYVTDEIDDNNGFAINVGGGVNLNLSFMTIKLNGMVDAMDPERADDEETPFTIGLSTVFTL